MSAADRFSRVLGVEITFRFENARQIGPQVNWHHHLPRSSKDFRVLDRYFIPHGIRRRSGKPFRYLQSIAVKIAGVVEPCLIVESGRFDNERIPVPTSS